MADPSRRSGWSYLLLEASLIVLSVLLGFGISEWRSDQADRELARRAVETLRREIVANQRELATAVENHEEVVRRLREEPGEPIGIRPAVLRNSAWTTAQATSASLHLDYEVAEIAAELHELQELHREAQIMTFERLSTIALNAGGLPQDELEGMRISAWSSLIGLEHKLLEEYDRSLDQVGAAGDRDR